MLAAQVAGVATKLAAAVECATCTTQCSRDCAGQRAIDPFGLIVFNTDSTDTIFAGMLPASLFSAKFELNPAVIDALKLDDVFTESMPTFLVVTGFITV
jgi:hypothetical protein